MSITEDQPGTWADSKEAWRNRVHDAVMPSGIQVTYRDLSLAEWTFLEALPTELLEMALAEWETPGAAMAHVREPLRNLKEKPTAKQEKDARAETERRLEALTQINREVVAHALVEPRLTVEELREVPLPDLEMLSLLVHRQLVFDAAGRRVGVAPVETFREVVAAHGLEPCDPGCPSCEEARRALATPR
jgi:hypothetical protein